MNIETALSECPIMAILRGVSSSEVEAIGEALVSAGVRAIEIPLNSPGALASINILARSTIGPKVVGAGTVLSVDAAKACGEAGARFVVSPNCNPAVIRAARPVIATAAAIRPTIRPAVVEIPFVSSGALRIGLTVT